MDHGSTEWADGLLEVTLAINTQKHSTIGCGRGYPARRCPGAADDSAAARLLQPRLQSNQTGKMRELSVQNYYFFFLFVQVFLVVSIASGTFATLAGIADVTSIPGLIRELNFQTEHIKNRMIRHQNSSPSSINDVVSCLVKGAEMMMHSAVLLKAEVKALQAANEQKKRRERKCKRHIMQCGSLSVRDAEDILHSAEVDAQIRTEVASETTH
jgi:hypothetical protein